MASPVVEREVDNTIAVALEFAECKLSLAQMIDDQWLEVHRILGSQRARLLGGLTEQPDDSEIERAARGLTRLRFFENCRDQPEKMAEWLRGRRHG